MAELVQVPADSIVGSRGMVLTMGKALSACILATQLLYSPSTHADEPASNQKCERVQPENRVHPKTPPVKVGHTVQEISVYCDSDTTPHAQPPDKNDKCKCSPEEFKVNQLPEILDAMAKLIAAFAWPGTAITILLLLRPEIKNLLSRVKRGKFGSAEIELAEYLHDAAEQSERELPLTTPPADAIEKATNDPRGTVLSAWIDVEAALRNLLKARDLGKGHTRIDKRPLTSIRLLQEAGILSPNYIALFQDLRVIRNAAAHSSDFSLPAESVVQFVQLTEELTAELRRQAEPPRASGNT